MDKKIAVVAGSFDPITKGHEALIRRTAKLFDEVIVAICVNDDKKYMFDVQKRLEMIKSAFCDDKRIIPMVHQGLVADLAKEKDAVIVKGLRYAADFDYEHLQAESNYLINGVETLFLPSRSDEMFITSSLVRELVKANKPFNPFVSEKVAEIIKQ